MTIECRINILCLSVGLLFVCAVAQANAVMKAHNEKMASLLLDEDPAARHKPVHMGDALPVGSPAAETSALMDELKAETDAALEDAPEN